LSQPRQPRCLIRQFKCLQRETLSHERATPNFDITELRSDILNNAIVCSSCRAEYWYIWRYSLQYVHETSIVGSEVVTPIRDAVRLVNDEQADPIGDGKQDIVHEIVVCEPLRR